MLYVLLHERLKFSFNVTSFLEVKVCPKVAKCADPSCRTKSQNTFRSVLRTSHCAEAILTQGFNVTFLCTEVFGPCPTQAHVRELVRLAELYQKQRVSTQLIKELLAAPNADVAQRCLRLVEKEKGAGN